MLVALSTLFYYRFLMFDAGRYNDRIARDDLDSISAEISQGIAERYPDLDEIGSYIQEEACDHKNNIMIYDLNKQTVASADVRDIRL